VALQAPPLELLAPFPGCISFDLAIQGAGFFALLSQAIIRFGLYTA